MFWGVFWWIFSSFSKNTTCLVVAKKIIMLGEGVPWHIVLVFFFLAVLIGINNGKKEAAAKREKGS
jgi:hypothetical protein